LRQREVLQLLAEGRSMKEVGYILDVAPRTVAFHKYKMMELFHLRTNTDLLRFALTSSLVAVT
jgi:DNA-binding CsgD family transcriptional regulator